MAETATVRESFWGRYEHLKTRGHIGYSAEEVKRLTWEDMIPTCECGDSIYLIIHDAQVLRNRADTVIEHLEGVVGQLNTDQALLKQ